MTGNAKGEVTMQANGETYRLHLGMSVLADLQDEFGDRLEALLTLNGASNAMPDLKVLHSVFLGALQRYHSDVADRWLVDDIIAQNEAAWVNLITGTAPKSEPGKPAGKKKTAAA